MRISTIKTVVRAGIKLSTRPLVASAGMPRSGSTLLFNILREILATKWNSRLSSGWEGDFLSMPTGSAYLIKTHRLSRLYHLRAKYCFYTYRDVRVAAVSDLRKFGRQISLESVREVINQYEIAKKLCNRIIKYEEFIKDPIPFINDLAHILGINVDPNIIHKKTFALEQPAPGTGYSKVSLLHSGHCTETKDHEWRQLIDKNLQMKINKEFAWWFNECGYPPE
jgi:hypothetical protein